jgi:hypothetical protein
MVHSSLQLCDLKGYLLLELILLGATTLDYDMWI